MSFESPFTWAGLLLLGIPLSIGAGLAARFILTEVVAGWRRGDRFGGYLIMAIIWAAVVVYLLASGGEILCWTGDGPGGACEIS